MTDLLTDKTAVKLRIVPSGAPAFTTDDTLLDSLITQVSAWIAGYTGRKFLPDAAATYTFDTEDGYTLRIPYGIRAVTQLQVATQSQPDSGGTYTVVPSSDYLLRPLPIDRSPGWPATELRISRGTRTGTIASFGRFDNGAKITGDFGWSAVPDDIAAVAIDGVVTAYSQRRAGASGALGPEDTLVPSWAAIYGKGSPQMATLDRYRFIGLG